MKNSSNPIVRVAVPSPLWQAFDYVVPVQNGLQNQSLLGLRVKVPFGRRQLMGVIVEENCQSNLPQDKIKSIEQIIDTHSLFSPALLTLYHWASEYYHYPLGEMIGSVMPKWMREGRAATPTKITYYLLSALGKTVEPQGIKRSPKQSALLNLLAQHEQGLMLSEIQEKNFDKSVLNRLITKQYINQVEKLLYPEKKSKTSPVIKNKALVLNNAQQKAVNAIIQESNFQVYLLIGVTGSGKTEVYLQSIEHVLKAGKQALVLVPEIALTPQTVARFTQRFDVPIILLHSELTDNERMQAWVQSANQKAAIVIGTRSAVFVPMPNLGMIVLDEEHDTSFKQQSGFRYSGRDMAVMRARIHHVPIILGSATPSLESLYNAKRKRYQILSLPKRAGEAQAPKIRLVNLCNQTLKAGLSDILIETIRQHIAQKGQVLLFLNRRGYAPVLMCHHCGWAAVCPHCDARMTLHQKPRRLICHHCATEQMAARICPSCHQQELANVGLGTEQIEQQLSVLFPEQTVLRIDRDSTQKKGSLQQFLQQIQDNQAQIMIGTQMLAKGHHFPKLTLVAIVDADSGLFSVDFRAMEKMAQLLVQVSGRAGREQRQGEVMIQTHHPEHPLLKLLLSEGYLAFADEVLKERSAAQLPPFSHLALLRAEGRDQRWALYFLQEAKERLEKSLPKSLHLIGPIPAPMERKANFYRAHLLLQSKDRKTLQTVLQPWVEKLHTCKVAKKVRWSLDIDPQDML